VRRKRLILVAATLVLAVGAILLALDGRAANIYAAQALIGLAGPFLGPTIAAITMGVVGPKLFDGQFGRNQGFNAAGNLFAAAVIAMVSHLLGNRAIFYCAAVLTLPTTVAVLRIRKDDIDLDLARGALPNDAQRDGGSVSIRHLARDRVLLTFLICAFRFHFASGPSL
jgi:predicted MFS family arabinose efflux permease